MTRRTRTRQHGKRMYAKNNSNMDTLLLQMEQRLISKINDTELRLSHMRHAITQLGFQQNLVKYSPDDKVRIVFLFQSAAFWPSMETFYQACLQDPQFEVVLLCYDENINPTVKVETSREYLIREGYSFVSWESFDLDQFRPHILVLQTPYNTHRRNSLKSVFLRDKGIRTIYIPYGIEIADTESARIDHFKCDTVRYGWRTYTFSPVMLQDYTTYSDNYESVRALGLPKFDNLYHRDKYPLSEQIREKARGRKIVLWKLHFPKVIVEGGKKVQVTPYLEEYMKFLNIVGDYTDLFFIFMPHPRFREITDTEVIKKQAAEIMDSAGKLDNVFVDIDDDYRPSLVNADYIITDRSAVMVEAGATGAPILYMHNSDFIEPMTRAVAPLIESYYQGSTCEDMVSFIEMCKEGSDPKKEARDAAFKYCVPYFDGQSGQRIKEDIIQGLLDETKRPSPARVELTSILKELEDNILERVSKRVWSAENRLQKSFEETHNHIEYTYRDIMVVLEKQLAFAGRHQLTLITDHPIAYESIDHLFPRGTVRDNTRYPRFIKKCETFFPERKELAFLDLGCSGGGMVLDAALRGHLGIGLEGSDTSLILQRAEWRLLKDNLFTCDITKPYALVDNESGTQQRFDVISAWEVLEHINESDLEMFFHNVMTHLAPNGIFAASIANWDDIDPNTGVNWHVTTKPYEWWVDKCEQFGFEVCSEIIHTMDLPRGGINPPIAYKEPSVSSYADRSFHIVIRAKQNGHI